MVVCEWHENRRWEARNLLMGVVWHFDSKERPAKSPVLRRHAVHGLRSCYPLGKERRMKENCDTKWIGLSCWSCDEKSIVCVCACVRVGVWPKSLLSLGGCPLQQPRMARTHQHTFNISFILVFCGYSCSSRTCLASRVWWSSSIWKRHSQSGITSQRK